MLMEQYIKEIEHAATLLIDAIWHEQKQIDLLRPQLDVLERRVHREYEAARSIQESAEDADDLMLGVGRYWENYFGPDKERHHKQQGLDALQDAFRAHDFSIGTLAAGLLQHAKQGISLVHGGLAGCPDGRLVGTQPLREVVWQGRNQALHWEEGHAHPPVERCFQALSTVEPRFTDYNKRNLAFDLVAHLGWKTVLAFRDDLLSLK